ncbi:hypothetical protein D3C80_1246560 [compost metagenome]
MLNSAGDTHGDVQLRRDDLASLTDLHVVGHEPCVYRRARSTNRSAELVGQAIQVAEVVTVAHATAAGYHDLGGGQFGAVGLGQRFADKCRQACICSTGQCLDWRAAAFCRHGVKTGGAHGDDFYRSAGLDGGNGVTGVDRTLEGVSGFDRNDLGDLVDIQQRSYPWQEVLAVAGGRRQHMAEVAAQVGHQGRHVFRKLMGVGGIVCQQHFAHASALRGGERHTGHVVSGYEHHDVSADLASGGQGVQGRASEGVIVVFSNYQNAHQITFASFFSFSTNSATDLTLIPALRAAGASTFKVVLVEARDTPRSPGLTVSSGFFLAFMMFGSDA